MSLTFTAMNWSTPQMVTVTGADDFVLDGDVAYAIVTDAAVSADSDYNGINPSDVAVTNTDDDVIGVTVTPTSGLVTNEAGGTSAFNVVLTSQPTASVSISLMSSNTAEGTVAPASVTFTTMNWSTPQTVTVSGVNDFILDGDVAYTIVTGNAVSADADYNGQVVADVSVTNRPVSYIKASNTGASDSFGYTVALSADSNTLAVGAYNERSNATGIDGNQSDNSLAYAGAVYIFTRAGSVWSQEAYIKASNTGTYANFGQSVSLSSDGNTLAVGANGERSNATGINGNQADASAANAGATYVFTRAGSAWTQEAYIKASNTGGGDGFGRFVALSSDGNTLAVGASSEASSATGIDGNQADNAAASAGAAYVLTRAGSTWTQQAYIKASNTGGGDIFGNALALSSDGNTLAVASGWEDSNAIGIDGNQSDNSAPTAGAVYVFAREGSVWTQQAYAKASNTDASDWFGASLALSSDGNTLAVGASGEASNATGIGGNQTDNSAANAGAVYVFTRAGSVWVQHDYIKASNSGANDDFGRSVALSSDGNTLAVGADGESSNATGINGNQTDGSVAYAGAAYVFTRVGSVWTQQDYVKASNSGTNDYFGNCVAMSADGNTLAVGAYGESSNATAIDGNPADNSASGAGAVYLY
ncbi:MAG: integrin [Sandaracinaceae bacterium]|nr:integrin [Sandaracinaceae bacterium]